MKHLELAATEPLSVTNDLNERIEMKSTLLETDQNRTSIEFFQFFQLNSAHQSIRSLIYLNDRRL